jgi:hypothetical protein
MTSREEMLNGKAPLAHSKMMSMVWTAGSFSATTRDVKGGPANAGGPGKV